ncbi:glycosyl hydrolase family 76-domain-containing protein [Fimicolochytrium jonesii]|uniref:glycosyl hydrolase family 76-domain-containing protein n=1 Tax=Fimicolochytrium jonesii TaxID=1396493 RepID=UPI0022FE04A2|nr:glycosyl hydrolase family 76-domain-containing protein [Fimicolochytrium jonesii]KAI8822545.1 glycosyl hydrolase family 76-domain-containing protein [Fimicolochytrium jonesii]
MVLIRSTLWAAAALAVTAAGGASAANLNVQDKAALGAATHAAMQKLVDLYKAGAKKTSFGNTAGVEGAFDQNTISWYASGIMWDAAFRNSAMNGDKSQDQVVGEAISEASFGSTGDLLGGSMRTIQEKLRGKWNDDIAWWAIAMMSATDSYGLSATTPNSNGKTFLSIAELTMQEMWEQWDPLCGGGVYWSRDRNAAKGKDYKSAITNAEAIVLGARLAVATNNQTYLTWASNAYNWMKTSQIVGTDWVVRDGMEATTCVVNTLDFSYTGGTLISGLAYMYKATKVQSYLDDAANIAKAAIAKYQTNGILAETPCAVHTCTRDNVVYLPQLAKGLGILYTVTTDAALKTSIQTIIDNTLTSAVKNCDDTWMCSRQWITATAPVAGAYDQYPTTELLLAASAIHGATVAPAAAAGGLSSTGTGAAPASGATPAAGGSNAGSTTSKPTSDSSTIVAGGSMVLAAVGVVVLGSL